ncbi:hypothetical protein B0H14DRAFT_3150283 [Mycena olivaceomarginata]|nr:hypothetical protein B0H14DRAFT_3150283 [Mycena olivaceomarginata]
MLIMVKEREKPIDRRGSLAVLGARSFDLPRPEFRVRCREVVGLLSRNVRGRVRAALSRRSTMRFKHGYAGVAGTSHQQNIKTQPEAEGRADYQQTDATSISTLTARMAAVSTKRGQLHRRWGWANRADGYTEGGGLTSINKS